jgi:hypothetical protein
MNDTTNATATTETPVTEQAPKPKLRRGFAAMDRSKVAEIASKGGKAAHAVGTAHKFSSDEARAAGKKGGNAPHVRRGRGPAQAPEAILPSDVVDGKVTPNQD